MNVTIRTVRLVFPAILALALMLPAAPLVDAETPADKNKSGDAATASQAGAKSPGGPQEGIKVHGHWVIEVRNPDGTVAETREFENALAPFFGSRALSNILGRRGVPGAWTVFFGPAVVGGQHSGGLPCVHPLVGGVFCALSESNSIGNIAGQRIGDLAADVPTTGPNANKLVLAGSGPVTTGGRIGNVYTLLALCAPAVGPACAVDGSAPSITSATLGAPIDVVQGQIVQITVVISFS